MRRKSNLKLDIELMKILTNPFAGLSEPWNAPEFPLAQAKQIWKQIRGEVMEKWIHDSPGTRPPGYWICDMNLRHGDPRSCDQEAILKQKNLLTAEEKALLQRRGETS